MKTDGKLQNPNRHRYPIKWRTDTGECVWGEEKGPPGGGGRTRGDGCGVLT